MKEVAQMYASGIPTVIDKNPQKAVEYFQKAADKNYMPAKSLLGECYLEAQGVPKDEVRGLKLLREAARAKDPVGMGILGAYLARPEDPRPVTARKQEFEEAFKLLSEAREAGSSNALASLGAMYMNGVVPGVKAPDFKQGITYFKEGAEKGNRVCMFQYAKCLLFGYGVKANRMLAEHWYVNAAKEKFPPAIEWCRENKPPGYEPPPLTGPPATLTGPPQSLTQ